MLVGASRFGERALFRALTTLKERHARRRTLIVGAGRGGRSLLRELRETPGGQVVGFVDDDPKLRRRRMQGVPVLGSLADVERVLAATHPDVVLVTIPDAERERLDAVVSAISGTTGSASVTVSAAAASEQAAPAPTWPVSLQAMRPSLPGGCKASPCFVLDRARIVQIRALPAS